MKFHEAAYIIIVILIPGTLVVARFERFKKF